MTEVERLAAEQTRWHAKQADLRKELEAATEKCAALEAERKPLLVSALAESDLTEALRKEERHVQDLQVVVEEITTKLTDLATERQAAVLAENRASRQTVAQQRYRVAAQLQATLDQQVLPLIEKWSGLVDRTVALDTAAGLSVHGQQRERRTAITDFLLWKLTAVWGGRDIERPPGYHRKPFLETERELLGDDAPAAPAAPHPRTRRPPATDTAAPAGA